MVLVPVVIGRRFILRKPSSVVVNQPGGKNVVTSVPKDAEIEILSVDHGGGTVEVRWEDYTGSMFLVDIETSAESVPSGAAPR
jgi:hypothetical protein